MHDCQFQIKSPFIAFMFFYLAKRKVKVGSLKQTFTQGKYILYLPYLYQITNWYELFKFTKSDAKVLLCGFMRFRDFTQKRS